MTSTYKKELKDSGFAGHNAAYLESMYESYLQDPLSVDSFWQSLFADFKNQDGNTPSHKEVKESIRLSSSLPCVNNQASTDIDNIYRERGHMIANLDPLGIWKRKDIYLDKVAKQPSHTDVSRLKSIYCDSVGYEFMHIDNMNEREWILNEIESNKAKPTENESLGRLESIARAEMFEQTLGNRFVGQKRFSLEGCETLLPILDVLLEGAVGVGCKDVVIGMAHRGRLNVMVNALGMPFSKVAGLFEGKGVDLNYSGDVKYHLGYSSDRIINGKTIHVSLAYNPSHLEAITPVVMGSVRAHIDYFKKAEQTKKHSSMAIIVHGDSAVSGQGVVYECINMSYTPAYDIGGVVHIIVNNQLGFSTLPKDYRSGAYSSEVAKVIGAPVFHVNASDVDAVAKVAKLAIDYRNQFNKDVFIDLIGYRKYGHNEADEPSATQPLMYKSIRNYPGYHKIYSDKLKSMGTDLDKIKNIVTLIKSRITQGSCLIEHVSSSSSPRKQLWDKYTSYDDGDFAINALAKEEIVGIAKTVNYLPENFKLQKQIGTMLEQRRKMASGDLLINWGFAEMLAYASLLEAGFNIRLSGQDTLRGTFFHRHTTYFDHNTGEEFCPLQRKYGDQFQVYNSVLSEYAALGFEYGYSGSYPNNLVIWEAQFGDFANGGQIIMDQFISSAWQKWQRMSGLVLLLPHGYEGQGPEHSSARMERYLQLCAQFNMRLCVPTTPAQMYHLLRTQMLQPMRRPLIIFTPKSMLRHPEAVNKLDDLSKGKFNQVMVTPVSNNTQCKRVIICAGKIYYDLLSGSKENKIKDVVLVRIERVYPFPKEQLKSCIEQYNEAEFIWCQEEPFNQGAWLMIKHKLVQSLPKNKLITFVGRPESASPASGYLKEHLVEQKKIVQQALGNLD